MVSQQVETDGGKEQAVGVARRNLAMWLLWSVDSVTDRVVAVSSVKAAAAGPVSTYSMLAAASPKELRFCSNACWRDTNSGYYQLLHDRTIDMQPT
jgi:hypothetical protein